MSKPYTNLVVFGGAFCMIFLASFYMYQVLNDVEVLTNTQKLWKAIPAMAVSFIGVAIFIQRLLHQKEDKDLDKERKELQEKTNKIQEENNELRKEGIKKDTELINTTKDNTKEIHSFGKLLNDNVANDNETRRLISELTTTIQGNENSRNAEINEIKGDVRGIKDEVNGIKNQLKNHIKNHKQTA